MSRNVVIDTHALLWYTSGSSRLSQTALHAIDDPTRTCWVSAGSLMEIAIKVSQKRLSVPLPLDRFVREFMTPYGLEVLPVTPRHLDAMRLLPFHHKDPFDRLIIGQAIADDLTLVSVDGTSEAYDVRLLW